MAAFAGATQPLPVKPKGPDGLRAKREILSLVQEGENARGRETLLRTQFDSYRKQRKFELAEQQLELAERERAKKEAAFASANKKELSGRDRAIAREKWWQEWNRQKRLKEELDPSKRLWLAPGASTATIAWAYAQNDYGREQEQVPDYTQLWSYYLYYPGHHRIRLVYDHRLSDSAGKDGITPEPWDIRVATDYIDFDVAD